MSDSPDLPPLPPLPITPLGHYRHYKGLDYEVMGVARHSETLEPFVLYRPLYNSSGMWLRPHAMFFEQVVIDGVLQARFAFVSAARPATNPAGVGVAGVAHKHSLSGAGHPHPGCDVIPALEPPRVGRD